MVLGIKDAPLHMISHALEFSDTGPPPVATPVSGHPVALLHENSQGTVGVDGLPDLVQKRGPMVGLPKILASPDPGLAMGARNIEDRRGARGRLVLNVLINCPRE